MADWPMDSGATSIAMESTGVYRIPAFQILEARGSEVILANARYARNVLGHVDKWRSQSLMQAMSMKPRKLSAVLS